jgi:beta-N-acetylhexosaminidase
MKKFLIVLLVVLAAAAGLIAFYYFSEESGTPEDVATSPPASPISAQSSHPATTPSATASAPVSTATPTGMPEDWNDGGIFSTAYKKAYQKLSSMSLEEKVGQMILARCPDEEAETSARDYHLGGYVLFERDFKDKTAEEVSSAIRSYQDAAAIPLIMAVDEEGGTIVRISSNPQLADKKFRSPQKIYNEGGLDAIRADTVKKAQLLKELGLNLNLAPVADVSEDPSDYIYARTLGRPPEETGGFVAEVVETMQDQGLSSTLKHFPGYGNNRDTHTGIAIDERSLGSFRKNDFIPFEAGINAGAECVLVSHNIVLNMEKDVPASLSANVHRILREELMFTGVILTDDLSMDAIKEYTDGADPSVQAVLAGNDMLLTTDFAQSFDAVLTAVDAGKIPLETVDRAVMRILAWKYAKGIIQ